MQEYLEKGCHQHLFWFRSNALVKGTVLWLTLEANSLTLRVKPGLGSFLIRICVIMRTYELSMSQAVVCESTYVHVASLSQGKRPTQGGGS